MSCFRRMLRCRWMKNRELRRKKNHTDDKIIANDKERDTHFTGTQKVKNNRRFSLICEEDDSVRSDARCFNKSACVNN